jgi:hypothetical protein
LEFGFVVIGMEQVLAGLFLFAIVGFTSGFTQPKNRNRFIKRPRSLKKNGWWLGLRVYGLEWQVVQCFTCKPPGLPQNAFIAFMGVAPP